MKPIQHILCPIDFSEFSRRALMLARGLASDFDASLTVYHVIDTMPPAPDSVLPMQMDVAGRRRRAEAEMAALERGLEVQGARAEIDSGPPHRMIVRKAREAGADLVVMGTHGASGFEKLFLGSVTEKVLHQIEVPLLAVTRPAELATPSAKGGPPAAPGRRFRTILLAVDLEPGTTPTAEHALSLAQRYGARILALHVYPPPFARYGAAAGVRLMDEDLIRSAARLELEKLVPASVREVCPVEFLALKGDPAETIDAVARERGADLIVVGARGRGGLGVGWLGSTCHKVIRAGAAPVLAVRKSA